MIIQIVATGIIVIIFGQLVIKVIKDRTSFFKILFWFLFWSGALILIWLPPDVLDKFGNILGVGRGVDVLVYLSIILLFYTILKLNSKIDRLEKKLTILVRKIAKINVK